MACARSVSTVIAAAKKPRKFAVKIANPVPGGATHTSYSRALRFIHNDRAHFDHLGQLVFHGRNVGKTRAGFTVTDRPGGADAFPERAVLPPSAEVIAKMQHKSGLRVPLRPPLAR